jgi:ABC-type polar amino acid transport system ATPase subunit
MIACKNLLLKYSSKVILNRASFRIPMAKITAFVGPSGAGKTTVLRCTAGFHHDCEGEVAYEGKSLTLMTPQERSSFIGFVHQQFHLFPHLSVLRNCTLSMIAVQKKAASEAEGEAMSILASLGIDSLWNHSPKQLSGGQQQRVAIARALVLRPKVLLLDEPTSALDPERRRAIASILLRLRGEGVGICLSTHDIFFVKEIADRIYYMDQGAIVESFDRETDELASKTKILNYLQFG